MQGFLLVFLFIVGACFGSFLCCQARRLRLKETKNKKLGSRSVCLSCKKPLKWYDNLPIISWLSLKGKCRYCHKKIGWAEFLSEIGVGLAFLLIGTTINIFNADIITWIIFITTLIFTLLLCFLAIYDALYGELPTLYLIVSIVLAVVVLALKAYMLFSVVDFTMSDLLIFLLCVFISLIILGGLYLILYLISKGEWVGDGDWILGSAIAIVLFHPWFSLCALFLTNLFALIFALPNYKKNKKIHLGPFMVMAFVVTLAFANLLELMI